MNYEDEKINAWEQSKAQIGQLAAGSKSPQPSPSIYSVKERLQNFVDRLGGQNCDLARVSDNIFGSQPELEVLKRSTAENIVDPPIVDLLEELDRRIAHYGNLLQRF